MTTPIVQSITDEMVAELESAATDSKLNIYRPFGWAHSVRCGNHLQTDFDFLSLASPQTILALLAERKELVRDAERYRYWCRMVATEPSKMAKTISTCLSKEDLDAAIDAAMERQS